jgi:hypothetical protein
MYNLYVYKQNLILFRINLQLFVSILIFYL